MSPRVTVLMTVYNGVSFLRDAIESVLGQTFDDFEFLIIDDASTDESVQLIRSYDDARIRLVLNSPNIGQAASLNKGLEHALGEYVARLDQDDACLPGRLEAQVKLLDERADVAIVGTWLYAIDSRGRKIRRWCPRIDNFGAYLGTLALGLCPMWHPSVMYRRKTILEFGGYDPAFAPADDYDLWTKVARARLNGAIVPEFLNLQRVHGGRQSITGRAVQEQETRRSHDRFVREFSDSPQVEALGWLMRLQDGLWNKCPGKDHIVATVHALEEMISKMNQSFDLSCEELSSLRSVLYGRLGLGVKLGPKLAALPASIFYVILVALSPVLVERLRGPAAFLKQRLPELRYPGHLF